MRDVFGADTPTISEGAPAAAPTPAIPAAPAAALAPAAAAPAKPPTLDQAVSKAVAKAKADEHVQTDPAATHAVNLAATHPNVLGATLAGAVAGSFIPVIGTLVGAAIGFASSKYQIAGDPLGKIAAPVGKVVAAAGAKVKAGWTKAAAPATLPHLK
jgi:hypothetical protein